MTGEKEEKNVLFWKKEPKNVSPALAAGAGGGRRLAAGAGAGFFLTLLTFSFLIQSWRENVSYRCHLHAKPG